MSVGLSRGEVRPSSFWLNLAGILINSITEKGVGAVEFRLPRNLSSCDEK